MDVTDLMHKNIIEYNENLDPNEPRDFTNMMLIEIEQTEDESSSLDGQLDLDNFDLFLAD